MRTTVPLLLFSALLLFNGVCSVSAPTSPSRIVNGFFSNAFSVVMKWVLSLKTTTRTAMTGRPLMKFEGGYNVETVFDGSKLGIEPHRLEILPDGDLLILDSVNSNLYKITSSLSLYSRPRMVMGSVEGSPGHVDGRLRDARMNHPKGLTVDDWGNVYIADTDNMAIRKISDAGVTTIAGGKRGRGSGHVDGPSEDAKFSNDFDVVYLGSSCSLLVIDRGNKAIREIQLHFDDCAYQYGSGFPHGIAMLLSAGFFGYMLALLQRRIGLLMSSQYDGEVLKEGISSSLYQKPFKSPLSRSPLIPADGEPEKQEETFLGSLGQLVEEAGGCATEIMGGLLPAFKKNNQQSENLRQDVYVNGWPVQESFVIPTEDEPPPPVEKRAPTPKKTYAFMSKDSEKMQQLKQSRAFYSGWDVELQKQQQQLKKHHQHHNRSHSSVPQTYYEQSSEKTNEVVFGVVQEQDKLRKSVVMKPLDHGNPAFDHQNLRSRFSYNQGR